MVISIKNLIMMNRLLIFVFFSMLFTNGYAQNELKLEDCIKISKENYPLIASFDLIEKTKSYSLDNVKKNYYPKFSATLIGGFINGLPSTNNNNDTKTELIGLAQLDQVIWDGGITKNKKKLIEAENEVKISQLNNQLYLLEQKVSDIFFGLLLIDLKIEALQTYKTKIKAQKKQVSSGIKNGLLPASDLTEIQIAELNIEKKEVALQSHRETFSSILGLYMNQDLKNATLVVPEYTFTENTNSFNRPEYKTLNSRIAALDAQENLQQSSLTPKIGIKGIALGFSPEIGIGPASTDAILFGGLSLAWNIDALYKNKTNKEIIAINKEQIQVEKNQLDFNLSIAERMERRNVYTYQKQVDLSKQSLNLQQKLFKSYQSQYNQGIITIAELIRKLEDLKTAQIEVSTQKISFYKAIFNYNYITGK